MLAAGVFGLAGCAPNVRLAGMVVDVDQSTLIGTRSTR